MVTVARVSAMMKRARLSWRAVVVIRLCVCVDVQRFWQRVHSAQRVTGGSQERGVERRVSRKKQEEEDNPRNIPLLWKKSVVHGPPMRSTSMTRLP